MFVFAQEQESDHTMEKIAGFDVTAAALETRETQINQQVICNTYRIFSSENAE